MSLVYTLPRSVVALQICGDTNTQMPSLLEAFNHYVV